MTTISDVFHALCRMAPLELQMDFDNAGFQLGRSNREVRRVLLALDVTDAVAEEALAFGAELIISHHPLIFSPLKAVTDADPVQKRVLFLIENDIALISMHTNLDIAEGGVNDVLIRLLGAEPETALDSSGCGRIGRLPEALPLSAFLERCKDVLGVPTLRYAGGGERVSKIAVMGGSGGGSLEDAVSMGCDAYVTSDVKYHQFQQAAERGLTLIDADHFYTENPIIPALADLLRGEFPAVEFRVSREHHSCVRFL